MRRLTRKQMLAAEPCGYSFANYAGHLGIGNIRFEKLTPPRCKCHLWYNVGHLETS
jgi:hypothetical protein